MSARLCLNMIVRDEAPGILRCLESLLPLTDCWVICDTGSTDHTAALIEGFFAHRRIPGELHRIPFHDFGQARNEALDLCRASELTFDYILFCDADMELRLDEPAEALRRRLTAPAYLLLQRNTLSYYNLRILGRHVPARYAGVTHEVLRTEAPRERLAGAWFLDHASGSSRKYKLARDLRLLEAGLRREPDNARYRFYLAQTLYDAGEYARAAEAYRKRIEAGGWEEEVWYALHRLALCHLRLNDSAAFIDLSFHAYRRRPHRAEPLYELARALRQAGDHEAAMSACETGIAIPYPHDDVLFIDNRAYTWGFPHEMGISGFYCGDPARREAGRRHCHALSVSREVPGEIRDTARRNALYYARPAADLLPGLSVRELRLPTDEGDHPMNPSLCLHGCGMLAMVRCVNYTIADDGRYVINDPGGVIRSRNVLVTLSGDLSITGSRVVVDDAPGPRAAGSRIRGFEDCRLFSLNGRLHATCTVRDRDPRARCEIALLDIEPDGRVTAVHPERSYNAHLHQKNWMPLVRDGALCFVYGCDPTVILQYDFDTRQAREIGRHHPPLALDHLRGGSQALAVPGGWLCLVHEVTVLPGGRRVYLHRFVHLDKGLRISSLSEPFHFISRGIEFCAGLAHEPGTDRCHISFGVDNARAFVATFSLAAALALCHPVDTLTVSAHRAPR